MFGPSAQLQFAAFFSLKKWRKTSWEGELILQCSQSITGAFSRLTLDLSSISYPSLSLPPSQGLLRALPHSHGGVQGGQRGHAVRVQDALQEEHHLAPGAHSYRGATIPGLAHTGPRPPAVPADPAAARRGHPTEHLLRQEAAGRLQVRTPAARSLSLVSCFGIYGFRQQGAWWCCLTDTINWVWGLVWVCRVQKHVC